MGANGNGMHRKMPLRQQLRQQDRGQWWNAAHWDAATDQEAKQKRGDSNPGCGRILEVGEWWADRRQRCQGCSQIQGPQDGTPGYALEIFPLDGTLSGSDG